MIIPLCCRYRSMVYKNMNIRGIGMSVFKKLFLFLVLMSTLGANLYSEVFRFKYFKGEKYRIVTEVNENVYVNGKFSHRADILDKIAVEVRDVKKDAGLLSCVFQTSERAYGKVSVYKLTDYYHSLFWRDGRGIYDISPEYFMPVVRNVPTFPEGDIHPGDTWVADGEEVHDFRRGFGVNKAFHFPITVNYKYENDVEKDGKKLYVIRIKYSVFYKVGDISGFTGNYPRIITGFSEQVYYWNNEWGKPDSYSENFDFIFHLSSGDYVEYTGSSKGKVYVSESFNRDKVKATIEKEIKKKGIKDATVEKVKEGVRIRLENIHFPPNSAILLPEEKEKLRKIGEILKQYPDRDVVITGHTARIGTEESCQILSEKRARAVGDFLLSIGAKRATQMVFKGMGSRVPIGDNSTPEGRAKNRRVEITILEN